MTADSRFQQLLAADACLMLAARDELPDGEYVELVATNLERWTREAARLAIGDALRALRVDDKWREAA